LKSKAKDPELTESRFLEEVLKIKVPPLPRGLRDKKLRTQKKPGSQIAIQAFILPTSYGYSDFMVESDLQIA
jgi:hypothetical protein